MVERSPWEDCRTALRELGTGVVWADVAQVIGVIARQSDRKPASEDALRHALDEHAAVLVRGRDSPIFLADGAGRYAILEAPAVGERDVLSEARVRDIMCGCLSRLGPALGTSLQLVKPEFEVEGKYIDIAAKGSNNALWVIEIKIDAETGDGVSQVASYVTLCKKHKPGYNSYWGVVVAPRFSTEAKTIAKDRQIRLCDYRLCAEYTRVEPP
jgi:hypothetical protein